MMPCVMGQLVCREDLVSTRGRKWKVLVNTSHTLGNVPVAVTLQVTHTPTGFQASQKHGPL